MVTLLPTPVGAGQGAGSETANNIKNNREYETKTYQNDFKGGRDAAHARHVLRGSADGGAADITQNTAVVINSSNRATYHNKSIAGTVPADSYTGNGGTFASQGAVVVDGIELNLTTDGFNVEFSSGGRR